MGEGLLVARSAYMTRENNQLPVKVMNFTPTPLKVRRGQVLGTAEIADSFEEPKVNQNTKDEGSKDSGELNERQKRLREIIDVKHLEEPERERLLTLIMKYHNVFSIEGELGTTDILQATVDTGNSPPISIPQYRIPYAYQEGDVCADQRRCFV